MKRIISSLCILVLILFLTGFGGTINNVEIDYGSSVKFSEAEIKSAIDIVLVDFAKTKAYKGCDLIRLWYDETESNRMIENYMVYGHGSANGVEKENVIILQAHFNVSKKANIYFNPPSVVTNWSWILIRNNVTNKWTKDDAGWRH